MTPAVLIPRPETECLIDLALATAKRVEGRGRERGEGRGERGKPIWADVGTGSGAIALGLADAFPESSVYAVDYSSDALVIARANAETYHLVSRIQFYQGSWLEPLEKLKGKLSGIVSNPPYIPSQMVLELQPEVTRHEPHLALDGGPDGLDCIRQLIAAASDYLHTDGILLFEMMAGQAIAVTELLQQHGNYDQIEIFPDLAGIDRFALALKR